MRPSLKSSELSIIYKTIILKATKVNVLLKQVNDCWLRLCDHHWKVQNCLWHWFESVVSWGYNSWPQRGHRWAHNVSSLWAQSVTLFWGHDELTIWAHNVRSLWANELTFQGYYRSLTYIYIMHNIFVHASIKDRLFKFYKDMYGGQDEVLKGTRL
jgi:hypothetical protein